MLLLPVIQSFRLSRSTRIAKVGEAISARWPSVEQLCGCPSFKLEHCSGCDLRGSDVIVPSRRTSLTRPSSLTGLVLIIALHLLLRWVLKLRISRAEFCPFSTISQED